MLKVPASRSVYTRSLSSLAPDRGTVVDPCNSRSSLHRTLQPIKNGRDYSNDHLQGSCPNFSQGVLLGASTHVGRFPTVALWDARKSVTAHTCAECTLYTTFDS